MADWVAVADSAVKIGLGALIGGGYGIWNLLLNHRHEFSRAHYERRAALLQEVQLEVSAFGGIVATFWASLMNAVFLRDTGAVVTPKVRTDLKALEDSVFAGFAALATTRGKLLLLGEHESEKALASLKDRCDEFFRIAHLDNPKCTTQELDRLKAAIVKDRTALSQHIAAAYARKL